MLLKMVQRESSFLGTVSKKLQSYRTSEYLFLGGDFNCTDDDAVDRFHAEPHPASQLALRQLVFCHGLVDVWRRMHTGCRHRENAVLVAHLDRLYCVRFYQLVCRTTPWLCAVRF